MADAALRDVVAVAQRLRRAGLDVGPGQTVMFARALALGPPWTPSEVRRVARACFARGPEDLALLDRVLAGGEPPAGHDGHPGVQGPAHGASPPAQPAAPGGVGAVVDPEAAGVGRRASTLEQLRHRDFERCTEAELDELARMLRRVSFHVATRPSRRSRPARRGARVDHRRLLGLLRQAAPDTRQARLFLARAPAPRPMVWLLDVSGSMSGYARPLLELAHVAVRSGTRVEVFGFGTRLSRLTPELRARHADAALAGAARTLLDAHGGTRIGASLAALLRHPRHRNMLHGAVVVVFSDGLERGEPSSLGRAMAVVSRLAATLVWVNPLKRYPGYEPRARGMAAALPSVDHFVTGHDLASLERLAALVGLLRAPPGPAGHRLAVHAGGAGAGA